MHGSLYLWLSLVRCIFYDNYLNFLLYINIHFRGAVRTNRDHIWCHGDNIGDIHHPLPLSVLVTAPHRLKRVVDKFLQQTNVQKAVLTTLYIIEYNRLRIRCNTCDACWKGKLTNLCSYMMWYLVFRSV